MKNYQDSDYAVNKHSEGIVYRFADCAVEVTLEDYLRENPDKTSADFAELKALSDEMYLDQDRSDYRQTYKDVRLKGLEETDACAALSPEDILLAMQEEAKHKKLRMRKAIVVLDKLTEVQRRRYLLYHVEGLTLRRIADMEGVGHTKIQRSIEAAEKEIQKFLTEG